MSANGEIEIAVKAEGVEDAAGEFDQGGEGGGPPGGGDGQSGESLKSTASSTGRMAGLLGTIVALLAVLEPVLKVLGVVSNVLQAFVAPLAMVLMRLLQPALRFLLQLLPGWLNWIEENEGKIDQVIATIYAVGAMVMPVLEGMLDVLRWLESIGPSMDDRDQRISEDPALQVGNLPMAAREGSIADLGPQEWFGRNVLEPLQNLGNGGNDRDQDSYQGPVGPIILSGGLGALVENIETNPNIDQ